MGTVVFDDGSTIPGTVSLGQGDDSSNNSTQGVGSHTITASSTGTYGWLNGVASMTQAVNPDPTTTTVAPSLIASVFGESESFTTIVSPRTRRRGGRSAI